MKSTLNIFILLCLIFFAPLSQGRESWTQKIFSKDQSNFYYVGISDGRSDLAEAMSESYKNAVIEAIKHNYGMKGEFSESMLSELNDITFQENSSLESKAVNLEEIEPVKESIEENNGKYKVFRMIKYPIRAIQKEKHRIKFNLKSNVNSYGNKLSRGKLFIKTIPENVKASLTGIDSNFNMEGSTNAKFHLPLGKYTLVLYKEGYEPDRSEIIITGSMTSIRKKLDPSLGFVNISIKPDDASIYINGRSIKNHKKISLFANKQYKLRIEHPDYFTKTEYLSVWIAEEQSIERELTPKISNIGVISRPAGAGVYLNGKFIGKTPITSLGLYPKEYTLKIEKDGYDPYYEDFKVHPNRKLPVKIITLRKEKFKKKVNYENKFKIPWDDYYTNDRLWSLSYDPIIIGSKGTVFTPFAIGLQYFPHKAFSIGINYLYDITKIDKTYDADEYSLKSYNEEATITSHLSYNMKFFLVRRESFQIGLGLEYHDLDVEKGPYDSSSDDIVIGKGTTQSFHGMGYLINLKIKVLTTRSGANFGIYGNYRDYHLGDTKMNYATFGVSLEF